MYKRNQKEFFHQSSISSYEIERRRIFKRHLTTAQKINYFLYDNLSIIMLMIMLIAFFIPALVLPLCGLYVIAYLFSFRLKRATHWAISVPIYLTKKNFSSEFGLIYLGNDQDTQGKAVWLNREMLRTHMVIFGTTGSGKTEIILSMIYQYMLLGSGFIFVDGKASISTWLKINSMARKLGLEDNVLVLNFFTGGKSSHGINEKNSNTLNPFSHGSSDTLMEMLSGLMSKSSGENSMWRDRAEALGRVLLKGLCDLRDKGIIELSIDVIQGYMPLEKLEALAKHKEISEESRASIKHYLEELPGWKIFKNAMAENQVMDAELEAQKQHAYLTMQFTHLLELFSGTYSHITRTNLSEVDFLDVIVNRRFLYIAIPTLEKSAETLKHIGKIVVMCIRNALSRLLGAEKLTGSREFLLDAKAFNADIPFGLFLDEYGSYCVEGFAEVAAQARELNIMVSFSGQDYASFKKGSEIEAQQIISNTGIKMFLKTECAETKKLATERGSKSYAYLANHIEKSKHNEGYQDSGNGALKEIDRIVFDDLFKQKPGEAHVLYSDKLWRIQSFYGDFEHIEYYRINSFIKLAQPVIMDISINDTILKN